MELHEFTALRRQKKCRHGQMLYHPNDTRIGQSLEYYGEYAALELALLGQMIKPGQTVVEAGANIGTHTLFMARVTGPKGSVMSFEAQRLLYQDLCANMSLNDVTNVYPFNLALSDKSETIRFDIPDYEQPGDFGAVSHTRKASGQPVKVTTIDDLKLKACDLMLVDVYGMEANVLAGAARTLLKFKPRLYVDAFVDYDRPQTGRILDKLGYEIFWHRPALFNPRNFEGENENIFGDETSHKFLCLPKGHGMTLKNMERVDIDTL